MASLPALMAILAAALYLAPTLIGWARHVPHLGSVAVVNALFGWTLIGLGHRPCHGRTIRSIPARQLPPRSGQDRHDPAR